MIMRVVAGRGGGGWMGRWKAVKVSLNTDLLLLICIGVSELCYHH